MTVEVTSISFDVKLAEFCQWQKRSLPAFYRRGNQFYAESEC